MAKGVKGSTPAQEDAPKRTSIILRPAVWKKIKYISLMEQKELTTILDEALNEVISRYEKKNGPIPTKS